MDVDLKLGLSGLNDNSILGLLRNCQTIFQVATPFTFSPAVSEGSDFSTSLANTCWYLTFQFQTSCGYKVSCGHFLSQGHLVSPHATLLLVAQIPNDLLSPHSSSFGVVSWPFSIWHWSHPSGSSLYQTVGVSSSRKTSLRFHPPLKINSPNEQLASLS